MVFLNDLPPEIIYTILDHVDIKTWYQCSLVNQKVSSICQMLRERKAKYLLDQLFRLELGKKSDITFEDWLYHFDKNGDYQRKYNMYVWMCEIPVYMSYFPQIHHLPEVSNDDVQIFIQKLKENRRDKHELCNKYLEYIDEDELKHGIYTYWSNQPCLSRYVSSIIGRGRYFANWHEFYSKEIFLMFDYIAKIVGIDILEERLVVH